MNTREHAGSFLRWVLWGTLVGALISGCGSKEEAVPVAPVGTEQYAGTPSTGSPDPSAATAVSPASSGLGASIVPQVTPSSSPSGLPQAAAGESSEELCFGIDRMEFVNEKVGWVAGENNSGPFLGRTSTGGADWAKAGTNGMYLTALAPMERDRGFAAGSSDCQEQMGIVGCLSKGIYETTDGGIHWTPRWETQTSREEGNPYTAEVLSVSPKGWGYAVAAHQLLLTTHDGGASWEAAGFTGKLEGFFPEKAVFTSELQGWAAGFVVAPGCGGSTKPAEADDGCRIPAVAYTDKGGSGWRLDELPEAERGEIVISISATGGNRASVLLFNRDNLEASFYSGTAGASGDWQQVSQFRGGRPYATDMHFLSADRGFVALTPGAGPIEGGLLATADGGKKWDMAPIENIYGVKRISFPDTRAGWLLGEGNGESHMLLRTRNGGESWEPVPLPLEVFGR